MDEKLKIGEVSVNDGRLKPNRLCKRLTATGKGLTNGGKSLVPDKYLPEAEFATVLFTAEEFIAFLNKVPLCCMTAADEQSEEIPQIGQRIPSTARQVGILDAWHDTTRTPQHKVTTIELALFNTDVIPSEGIAFGPDSLCVIIDAAGRTAAIMDEINDLALQETPPDHVIIQQKMLFQVNFDLSGHVCKALKNFLSHNRDAKKTVKGTNLAVENSLVNVSPESVKWDYDDELTRAAIVNKLYHGYPLPGTVLELLPWKYEGRSSESSVFTGKGNAAGLVTVLTNLRTVLKRSGITPKQLADVLYFSFRNWWLLCPESHLDAIKDNKRRFASTLALKVMTLITIRLYKACKGEDLRFREMVDEVFMTHFKLYKSVSYLKPNSRVMTADRFFAENSYFADEKFNSGENNSAKILSQINNAIDDTLGSSKRDAA